MAQTGFTPIQLYSSSTTGNTPAAADLLNSSGGSELAINIFDGKLFYKDSSGNVQVIGWKVVPVSAGGTGQTSYTDGQLLIGNSTGNTLTKATLTAGTGITITNGSGAITINGTGGTVTSVAALTLGTTGTDLSSTVANGTTTPVITLNVPTASATNRGALSSTDWSTFNGKQVALVSGTNIKTVNNTTLLGSGDLGTINVGYGGTGLTAVTAGYVPFGSTSTALSTDAKLYWDNTNKRLGVGTTAPQFNLTVSQQGTGVTSYIGIRAGEGGSGSTSNQAVLYYRIRGGGPGDVDASITSSYVDATAAYSLTYDVNNTHRFVTAGTERMRVGAGVSIGNTTDPGATNLSVTGAVALASLFGVSYAQTSTAAGTSIIDTGISIPTGGAVSAAYLAVFSANANVGGNGNYRGNGIYLINISSDFAGGNQVYQIKQTKLSFGPSGPFSIELTLAASSWNGTTDTTTPLWSSASQQLRVKIAGFTGTVGSYLDFKLIKLL